jgi:hypothetical protein
MLKILIFLSVVLNGIDSLRAQQPLTDAEALSQFHHSFDAASGTAHWMCTPEQTRKGMHQGWSCSSENTRVSVSVLLNKEVLEGNLAKTYVVASSKPVNDELGEYNCHACQPAIGVAVFVKQGSKWSMESSNPSVGFYGGWGEVPGVEILEIGPEKHGILLSQEDLAQGYESTSKFLLVPFGTSVVEAWSIQDEADNSAAIDPDDNSNRQAPYHVKAIFKFSPSNGLNKLARGFYRIEVISMGTYREDLNHPIKLENWTETYEFRDGEYRLLQHRKYVEKK